MGVQLELGLSGVSQARARPPYRVTVYRGAERRFDLECRCGFRMTGLLVEQFATEALGTRLLVGCPNCDRVHSLPMWFWDEDDLDEGWEEGDEDRLYEALDAGHWKSAPAATAKGEQPWKRR
jgi:hypothetical protein